MFDFQQAPASYLIFRIWSEAEYFRNVAGKAAAIISTGVWMGGRLATTDAKTLDLLKEFGLALGMANQISDDSLDLTDDLAQGTYTLPVIKGLAMTEHPDHPILKQLTSQSSLGKEMSRQLFAP